MCNVCCKEFKGWCKSFTWIEALLSLLEAFLLLVLIAFVTFLILHHIACSKPNESKIIYETIPSTVMPPLPSEIPAPPILPTPYGPSPNRTVKPDRPKSKMKETLSPDVKCSWTPSQKTEATTRYYDGIASQETSPVASTTTDGAYRSTGSDFPAASENSDGEEVEEGADRFLLALVRPNPLRESTFGCALAAVSRHWALTAASCIEAVEEVDSLDAFVMLEGYGAREAGAAHAVAELRVHPAYARAGRARDVAALRSDDALGLGALGPLQLPTLMDHLLLTIGERFTIYGYGKFRTPEEVVSGRPVRAVSVYTLPSQACAGADDGWAPRHLLRGSPTEPSTGAIGPVCAGALYARGVRCAWCAGAPLARGRRLLGVQAGGTRCGGACEPALYVSLAAVRDWLDDLVAAVIV